MRKKLYENLTDSIFTYYLVRFFINMYEQFILIKI